MSFLQFGNAKDKEQVRRELREAREQMLEKAQKLAEQRIQREKERESRGVRDWMHPDVAEKFEKLNRSPKSKRSRKKRSLKLKRSRKHAKKRREYSSSSGSGTDSETESSSDESNKKSRKSSQINKKQRKRKQSSSSNSSDSSDDENGKKESRNIASSSSSESESNDDDDEWVECIVPEQSSTTAISKTIQRDNWMTEPVMVKTFQRERKEKKPDEKKKIEAYDPATSTRELNPYWKSTGTGLPTFKKPADKDYDKRGSRPVPSSATGNWRKQGTNTSKHATDPNPSESTSSSSYANKSNKRGNKEERESSSSSSDEALEKAADVSNFLTNQQMNELGAKLLKAEIMGDDKLAAELKRKLDNAHQIRAIMKDRKPEESAQQRTGKINDEHILLTRTDERGNTRPLAQASRYTDPRDLYGGRRKQKRVDTHLDGERVRYFPDDDKYDIKQMFQREKYAIASESNLQFANIVGKHKNPNDDLDDIFADEVRKNISQEDIDKKEVQRAIKEHKHLNAQLENCTRCLDSTNMDKNLLVSMGQQVYLSLPWHIGLQPGHCILAPTQHVSCCTQLDEDTWQELTEFRKSLTRMFAAQHKEVVFFEIANKLKRRPHLSIHCVPIPESDAENAPFYFKKAIEESEHEWSVNKQLVSLTGKNLRTCIPKGLPYFWVNFGMDTGFAHVIEDEERFPTNFAQEIIGGMLELDPNKWRRQQKEQNSTAKVKIFTDWWKKYDCTK